MKRLMVILGVVGMCVAAVNCAYAVENRILNPGFENDVTSWDNLWGVPASVTNTVKHLGGFSAMKLVYERPGEDYWTQIAQTMPCLPNLPVYARMYVKTTFAPSTTARAGVLLEFLNSRGNVINPTFKGPDIGGTNNWRLVEVSVPKAPAGTASVRISGYLWSADGDRNALNGAAYFDDAYLANVKKAVTPKTKLLNPAFENGLNEWSELYGYPAYLYTAFPYTGTYAAAKRVETLANQDYWSQLYQDVVCGAGKVVTASLYVKTEFGANATGQGGILVEFLNANNKVINQYSRGIDKRRDWQKLLIKVKSPSKTTKVRLSCFIYAPVGNRASLRGKAYFDNAALSIK